jgi:hypothetical protein
MSDNQFLKTTEDKVGALCCLILLIIIVFAIWCHFSGYDKNLTDEEKERMHQIALTAGIVGAMRG